MPRNLKGRGRNLKPSVFRPKLREEQKKVNRLNTSADVQFSAQNQVKSKKTGSTRPQMSNFPARSQVKSKIKKKVIKPSDRPLKSPLHHESFVHLSAGGGLSAPPPGCVPGKGVDGRSPR